MTTHNDTEDQKETKHFKMLSTQKGVREGEIHPVIFHEGKTYAIDGELKSQFEKLEAIEPSDSEPEEPARHGDTPDAVENWLDKPEQTKEPINEDVLDEDPAVLRHAEIPVEAVKAQNDAAEADGDMTPEAKVNLGRGNGAADNAAEEPDAEAEPKGKAKPKSKK